MGGIYREVYTREVRRHIQEGLYPGRLGGGYTRLYTPGRLGGGYTRYIYTREARRRVYLRVNIPVSLLVGTVNTVRYPR